MNKNNKRPSQARAIHPSPVDRSTTAFVVLAVSLFALGRAEAQGPGQPFLDPSSISPDVGLAIDLAVADLDGDGDLDVVEIKELALNRVFLNDGAGNLYERAAIGNDRDDVADSQGLVVVDVDNDSILDLVVANTGAPSRVYLGNGDGTFGPGTDLAPDSLDSRDVASADLDGNGYADLVIANSNDTNRIYLNDGTGHFIETSPVSADAFDTRSIVLVDFDGDGRADLVEGNFVEFNRLYLGNGAGGFGAAAVITDSFTTTFGVSVVDLDADGDLDIAEANLNQLDRVYLNDGFNDFTAVDLSGPVDLAFSADVADANGDGWLDILTGVYWGPNRLYLGDGAGNFAAGVDLRPGFDQTLSALFADLDGDLDPDVLEVVYGSVNKIYANDGTGTFTPAGTFSTDNLQTFGAASADVDGDGDLDFLEAKRDTPNRLYLNDGSGHFPEGTAVTGPQSTNAVIFVDVDNDGDPDIVEANGGDGNNVYRNDGTGHFDAGTRIGSETDVTRGLAAADLDGDGWIDLVAANSPDGPAFGATSRVYFNDGAGNFPVATDLAGFESTWNVAVGDLDGDGDADIVIANYGFPNRIHFNDGAGGFSNGTPLSADFTGTRRIVLADVDSDGDLDVVTANSAVGIDANARDRVYFNDGAGAFPASLDLTQTPDETFGLAVGDVDGDGDLDVVTGNRGGQNQLYLNDGSGGFAAGTPVAADVLDTTWVGLGDADASGTLDLFTANKDGFGRLQLNGNPTTSGLADVNANEDDAPVAVDLFPAFADLEDADAALTYDIVANTNPSVVATSVLGGTLTLTFPANGNGTAVVRVRATDTDGLFVESAFRVTVAPSADSPALLAPIPDQLATVGAAFSLGVSSAFADADGDALTFSAVGLPASFSIDAATGVISGTPVLADHSGSPFSVTVTANSAVAGETPAADTFELTILDTAAPVITILGANPALAILGMPYIDAGATASDGEDGDLTPTIVVVNSVNSAAVGTYTVTYTATDSSGNSATATRVVQVINDAPPVIALRGANPFSMEGGFNYKDPGATATDQIDGDLTNRIVIQYSFDPSRLGTYTVTYTVRDSAGLTATATRTVRVVDTTPPVLTVLDHATVTLLPHSVYYDAGASARDAVDGDLTRRIVVDNPVDIHVPNRYTVTYRVSDASGNAATATRTVVVTPDQGGGGAFDPLTALGLLIVSLLAKRVRRRAS